MEDNKKIHQILEYICSSENKSSVETDEIAKNLGFSLSEANQLARKIIENGDAKDCGNKDTSRKSAVCLLKIVETKDAYKTKKYLKMPDQKSSGYNITATNLQVGDNYGKIDQSSNESKIDGNDNTVIQGNKRSKVEIGKSGDKSRTNYTLIGIILTSISILVALIIGWDKFLNFFR